MPREGLGWLKSMRPCRRRNYSALNYVDDPGFGVRPDPPPPATVQTRRGSLLESLINVAIGYLIAVASQILIFPVFGIVVPVSTNFLMGLYFTAISIVRSYLVRRWFNGMATHAR